MLVERAADAEARRALLDEKHGDGLAAAVDRASLRGDTIEIGMHAVGDEHLRAVEHIAFARSPRGRPDPLHVRSSIGLSYGDRTDRFTTDDLAHPARPLRLASRVEDVHGGHIGVHKRRNGDAGVRRLSKFLGKDNAAERVHVRSAVDLGIADAKETECTHSAQHLARHKTLLLPGLSKRLDLFLDKAPHLIAQHFVFFGKERRARIRSMVRSRGDVVHVPSFARA